MRRRLLAHTRGAIQLRACCAFRGGRRRQARWRTMRWKPPLTRHRVHATCARVHLLLVYGYCMRQRAPLSRCLLGYRTRRSLPAGHRVSVDDRVTPKRAQHGRRSVLGRMWPNREAKLMRSLDDGEWVALSCTETGRGRGTLI